MSGDRMTNGVGESSPIFTVVIPHFDDPAGLDKCLSALQTQTIPPGSFETIIADNGSPQGQEAIAKIIAGRARLVHVLERGAGPARNAGAALATTRYLAFTDADCVPSSTWLQSGIDALTGNSPVDVVGGRVDVMWTRDATHSLAEAFEKVFAFNNKRYVEQKGFTVTANLMCARALFEQVGGFANGVPEDMEWCHRASAAGFDIRYRDEVAVAHPPRPDWPSLKKKWLRLNRERATLIAPGLRRSAKLAALAVALPLSIATDAPKALLCSELKMGDRFKALAGLCATRMWRSFDFLKMLLSRTPAA